MQLKVLRLLQEREAGKIRIVATTNRSLVGDVVTGRFRHDPFRHCGNAGKIYCLWPAIFSIKHWVMRNTP
ncbi:hypothetical protein [Geobacter sp. FeAm09]|uniref:hypothetical protein n=1 Tax=Geobacter sp. FeAm09 TaxID=2597769 RepID=UPI00197ADB86